MLTEQAILTALPAGVDRDRGVARLSCFITLRATGEETALEGTRFLRDWARVLSAALPRLEVEIDGVGRVPSSTVSDPPDPGLWRALFPASTPVAPHEPERWTQRPVATYAARAVHDHVVDVLARAALSSPTAPPASPDMLVTLDDAARAWSDLLDIPAPSQFLGDGPLGTAQRQRIAGLYSEPMTGRLDGAVAGRLAEAAAQAADRFARETGRRVPMNGDYLPATTPGGGTSYLQGELTRFLVFHHRPVAPPVPLPTAQELARALDVERIQTAFGAYRFLLRRLGLVVDLEVPLDAVQPDLGRIRMARPDADLPELFFPWTAYRLPGPDGEPVFRAAPRPEPVGERVADGMVDLGFRERFSLAQVDVDSAAAKTLNAALATTARALLPRPPGSTDTDAAPALRSTGVAVLHDGRAEALHGRLAGGHNLLLDLAGGNPPTLYAEDVTRGYRLDVMERRDGRWRSLHARRGRYLAVGAAAGALDEVVDDEGFTQLALGERPTAPGAAPDPTAPVYLHESIARWEGWSLSAPRPGLGLPRSPHAPTPGAPDTQPLPDRNEALPDGVPLEVTFHAQPGTLPRLRVGGAYQVRARAVDLAGNGPTLDEADALLAALDRAGRLPPVLPGRGERFEVERFDPLAGPAVVQRRPVTEGESVEHVVIRSDHDVTATDYAARTGYDADADRHVAPAKTALQDAELLGCFDAAIGSADPAAVQAAYAVALRESGRLQDTDIWDPELGARRPVPGVEVVPPRPDDPASGYVIHREEQLELPYLPDPWSAGAALVGLPGLTPGTVTRAQPDGTLVTEPDALPGLPPQPGVLLVGWGGRDPWWRAEPFRLLAVEGAGPPSWDAEARVLTVTLPKAARVDVSVSSLPDEHHLDEHGAWRALLRLASNPDQAAALRQLARTGRLWVLSPARTVGLVHAVQHPLQVPDVLALGAVRLPRSTSATLGGEIRIHGASTDRVDLAASWEEWVDEPRGGDDAPERRQRSAAALTQQVHLARDVAAEPPSPELTQAARYVEADDLLVLGAAPRSDDTPAFLSAHELHDTKHRRITYRATATSRFREYFRPDLVTPPGALTRESEPVVVEVPSSARPPAPHLLYAVPLFGWERGAEGRTRTTRRRGGGLRLFLARPWFASGDGELLGAVLWPGSASACPVPPALDRLVTRWGYDPVWPAVPPPATPGPEHFARRVAVGEDLPLAEATEQRVCVVGHEVEYDAERDQWTCDVELELGAAYTPFVRLALARYQPTSIEGAHLSPVSIAQIVQVTPERVVSLTSASDDPLLLSVTVTGPSHGAAWATGGVPFPYGSEVEVYVEERDDAIGDPEIGWRRRTDVAVSLDHGPPTRGVSIRWSGRVQLPREHVPGRHRVVVVERERLVTDRARFWGVAAGGRSTATRIVFAETVVV